MKPYLNTVDIILNKGRTVMNDRSGTGMLSVTGLSEHYDLSNGQLPLVSTRKLNFDKTLAELIWFISGEDTVRLLDESNVPFWKKWTSPKTNGIGPMYPVIWRKLPVVNNKNKITVIDQLSDLIKGLQEDPFSRRHYLSNVNLGVRPDITKSPIDNVNIGNMALDTCHREFFLSVREITDTELEKAIQYRNEQEKQFHTKDTRPLPKYVLESSLTMRSNDVMVGRPHNIAQYAAMTFIIAHVLNMHPAKYTHYAHDSHIYLSHVDKAMEQITREPFSSPVFYIHPNFNVESLLSPFSVIKPNNFKLVGYESHPSIQYALEG